MQKYPDRIFENKQLIVVDKPSGYLSVPSRMGKSDPRPVLGIILQDHLGQQLYPVHRLDEETSGLLIFAKIPKAQSVLSRMFERHQVQKTYQAVTNHQDHFQDLIQTTLSNQLVRGKKRSFQADHGQHAETFVVEALKFNSPKASSLGEQQILWTLEPKTGRSHQLRVQLAMRGFPILGDELYGSSRAMPSELDLPALSERSKAIALRAIRLEFKADADFQLLEMPTQLAAPSWS